MADVHNPALGAPITVFCTGCGAALDPAYTVCPACGRRVRDLPEAIDLRDSGPNATLARVRPPALPPLEPPIPATGEAPPHRRRTPWLWLPVGAVVVAAALVVLALVVRGDGTEAQPTPSTAAAREPTTTAAPEPAVDLADVLGAGHADLEAAAAGLSGAQRVGDVAAVAREAGTARAELDEAVATLPDDLEPDERQAVLADLAAQRDVLGAVAELARVSVDDLSTYPQLVDALRSATVALDDASFAARAAVPESPAAPVPALDDAAAAVEALYDRAAAQLLQYSVDYGAWQQDVASDRAALDAYERDAGALIARYEEVRDEQGPFATFVGAVEAGEVNVSYAAAWQLLDQSATTRQVIADQLGAMSVPFAGLDGAHAAFTQLIADAATAVLFARDAVTECEQGQCGNLLRSTSNWQEFQTRNGRIRATIDGVRSGWHQAVAQQRASIDGAAPPPRPDV